MQSRMSREGRLPLIKRGDVEPLSPSNDLFLHAPLRDAVPLWLLNLLGRLCRL